MGKGATARVPQNWPLDVVYLRASLHSPRITATHRERLQTAPGTPADDGEELAAIPLTLARGPCPLVKILPITDPAHPASGQHGLFAARDLAPGTLIVPYLGELHPGSGGGSGSDQTRGEREPEPESDYDLWVSRAADVAVDAARAGNEARFVNDYRGVPGRVARPNAEFREVWDARRGGPGGTGERGIAVFVCPAVRRRPDDPGIASGEEILVSYGKGFWGSRRAADGAVP